MENKICPPAIADRMDRSNIMRAHIEACRTSEMMVASYCKANSIDRAFKLLLLAKAVTPCKTYLCRETGIPEMAC